LSKDLVTKQNDLCCFVGLIFTLYLKLSFLQLSMLFVTVCMVVQNCCKGLSNKFRKWHFLGVLPLRNPLTDWHKIWHGWLHRGCHSIPQVACQLVSGLPSRMGEML